MKRMAPGVFPSSAHVRETDRSAVRFTVLVVAAIYRDVHKALRPD